MPQAKCLLDEQTVSEFFLILQFSNHGLGGVCGYIHIIVFNIATFQPGILTNPAS